MTEQEEGWWELTFMLIIKGKLFWQLVGRRKGEAESLVLKDKDVFRAAASATVKRTKKSA